MRNNGIALIGYGAIGREIAGKLVSMGRGTDLCAVLIRSGRLESLKESHPTVPFMSDLAAVLAEKPSVVVECAGGPALAAMGSDVLIAGCDLVAASSGAMVDDDLRARLAEAARNGGSRLLVPTGAIGAIDALVAMRLAGIDKAVYRGIKPPAAWAGSAAEELCDLAAVATRTVFFSGTTRNAAAKFPKNANVAAIIGMAGAGLDETVAELIADPSVHQNCHEVEASGPTGSFVLKISGNPSAENPRTSALTAYSILNTALTRTAPIVFS